MTQKISIEIDPVRVVYHEREGTVRYEFTEAYRGFSFDIKGTIPQHVVEKGKWAIRNYAIQNIALKIREHRVYADRQCTFYENPNIPVEVDYEGTLLKGHVSHEDGRRLEVTLDSPGSERAVINYGFGSAMAGHFMFDRKKSNDDLPALSANGLQWTERLLIDAYRAWRYRERNRATIDLVASLNQHPEK